MANYIEYHTHAPPLAELAAQYNYDPKFTYEVYRYNNKELNSTIIESIDKCLPTWDDRPTLESLDKRFTAGSFVMYQFYEGDLCGWFWLNTKFTHDWINTKKVKDDAIYVGGLYKLLDKDIPKHSAHDFGHYMMKYTADNYKYIYAIIEDWNKASIKLFEKYKVFIVDESFI